MSHFGETQEGERPNRDGSQRQHPELVFCQQSRNPRPVTKDLLDTWPARPPCPRQGPIEKTRGRTQLSSEETTLHLEKSSMRNAYPSLVHAKVSRVHPRPALPRRWCRRHTTVAAHPRVPSVSGLQGYAVIGPAAGPTRTAPATKEPWSSLPRAAAAHSRSPSSIASWAQVTFDPNLGGSPIHSLSTNHSRCFYSTLAS